MAGSTPPSKGDKSSSHSSSKSSPLVMIISLVNLLTTIALGVVVYLSYQKEKNKPTIEDIATGVEKNEEGIEADAEGGAGKSAEGGAVGKEGAKGESPEGGIKVKGILGKKIKFGKMVNLDQFTINLVSIGGVNPKFVRVSVSIEVPNEDVEAELTAKMPQVRNVIIDLFNSKRSTDLSTVDGREMIKDDIKNALNSFMVSGKITGVFFTSFAISS